MVQQVGLSREIEMEVSIGAVILRPAKSHLRTGWEQAFEKAVETGHTPDDDLLEGTLPGYFVA